MSARVLAGEPLAPRTTLELGGAAETFAVAASEADVAEICREFAKKSVPITVLGGGSNVVVADRGVPGLVLQPALRGIDVREDGDAIVATVAAGEPWDDWVGKAVAEGWQGLECLSGIPGWTGGAPIQNIGAYGQDISQTCQSVRVLDRRSFLTFEIPSRDCLFSYRHSVFRSTENPYVVLAVTFRLRKGAAPQIAYPELANALSAGAVPSLREVRETVLTLRRAKSMVIAADDENRRSAGSFFTNPIVDVAKLAEFWKRLSVNGIGPSEAPQWPMRDELQEGARTKLSAAWLIEKAGFAKGMRRGQVGISSRHALALVHHGGGTTAELLAFAEEIRAKVDATFGVALEMEPVVLGDFARRG